MNPYQRALKEKAEKEKRAAVENAEAYAAFVASFDGMWTACHESSEVID